MLLAQLATVKTRLGITDTPASSNATDDRQRTTGSRPGIPGLLIPAKETKTESFFLFMKPGQHLGSLLWQALVAFEFFAGVHPCHPAVFTETVPPRVMQHSPSGGVPLGLGSMEIEFSEGIDPATFSLEDAIIVNPSGQTNAITAIQTLNSNRFRITFPPLATPGAHRLRVGPHVQDLTGNLLDQDLDGVSGEVPDDVYDVCFYVHAPRPQSGLVAWWPGEGSAFDSAANNHGLLTNGTTFSTGKVGQAFSFDGTNDYVRIPDNPALRFSTSFTVSTWIWLNQLPPLNRHASILHKDPQRSGNRAYYFGVRDGVLDFGVFTNGQDTSVAIRRADMQLSLREWHHVAAVYSGAAAKLDVYIDGQLHNGPLQSHTGPGAIVPTRIFENSHPVFLGAYVQGDHPFPQTINALLDEVKVYNRALATNEIYESYLSGSGGLIDGFSPAGRYDGHYNAPISNIFISFKIALATHSLNAENITVDGQMGLHAALALTEICERTYQITFPPLTENGPYHVTLLPGLLGLDGLPLDMNLNGIRGEPGDTFAFSLFLDTFHPRLTHYAPAGNVSGTLTSVDVWFSERMDHATMIPANFAIRNPLNQAINATGVQEAGLNRFRISFPPQTSAGTYRVSPSTNIFDLAGNRLSTSNSVSVVVNLVPVDLQLADVVLSTNQLWAGQALTVSWTGRNGWRAPLLGGWMDAIYLSQDDRWDITDALLATAPQTAGLASNEVYSASATVFIPAKFPGNCYLIVRADIASRERETDEKNNYAVAGPVPLSIQTLSLGTFSGTLTRQQPSAWFAITLGPGEALRLTLNGQAKALNTLFISRDAIPTPQQSRYSSGSVGSNQQITVPASSEGGTYYVLVHSKQPGEGTSFQLAGETGPIFLNGISPNRHGNAANATVTVTGLGFDEVTTVEFVAENGSTQLPLEMQILSSDALRPTLGLTNWPAGLYTVRATKGTASNELISAFEVVQGGLPRLETHLIVPGRVGFNVPVKQTIWIEYRNTGDVSMPAPLLVLRGSHGARMTADTTLAIPRRGYGLIPGVSDTVQVLGLGSSSTPWILQPGESGRISVYYLGLSTYSGYPQVTFTLDAITADDSRVIDWVGQEPALRPGSVTDAEWAQQFQRLRTWFGPTWASYASKLSQAEQVWYEETGQSTIKVTELYVYSGYVLPLPEPQISPAFRAKNSGMPDCLPDLAPVTYTELAYQNADDRTLSSSSVFMSIWPRVADSDECIHSLHLSLTHYFLEGHLVVLDPPKPLALLTFDHIDRVDGNEFVLIRRPISGLPDLSSGSGGSWHIRVTATNRRGLIGSFDVSYPYVPPPPPPNPPSCPVPQPVPAPSSTPSPNCTRGSSQSVGSFDPNDKLAPAGYGEAWFIRSGNALFYEVRFENKSDATAPARLVTVSDTLDPGLDLSSLELFQLSFGSQTITLPTGLSSYAARIPLSFTNPLTGIWCNECVWVDASAALDFDSHTLTLTLSALDPLTGWYPEDPLLGLLYPEDGTGRGQGSISYRVSSVSDLPGGTRIRNRAQIVFDYNDPIDTPLVLNTIDSGPPSSSIAALPSEAGPVFLVQWAGQDEPGGSGLATYDIHVKADATNEFQWLDSTTATSAWFYGELGSTYEFYSIARDNMGQVESAPLIPDAQTYVPTNAPVLAGIANLIVDVGNRLSLTNIVGGTPVGSFLFTLGPGAPFGVSINPTNGILNWTPNCAQASRTNVITVWVTDTGNPYLRDAMTFEVVTRGCVVPQLGRLVLRAGDGGRVPVNLISSVALTGLTMTVEVPADRVTGLTLETIIPEICGGSILPLSNSLHQLTFTTCATQSLIGTQQIAWLNFSTVPTQSSAFVKLALDNTVGLRPDGTEARNFAAQAGRLVIIANEPLLEASASSTGQRNLILYAPDGSTNVIESTLTLGDLLNWQPAWEWTMTNLFQIFENLPAADRTMFYRARKR